MGLLIDDIGCYVTIPETFMIHSDELSIPARWLFVVIRYELIFMERAGDRNVDFDHICRVNKMPVNLVADALQELIDSGWVERKGADIIIKLRPEESYEH